MLNYWGIFFLFGVMPMVFILLLAVTAYVEKKDRKFEEVHVNEC